MRHVTMSHLKTLTIFIVIFEQVKEAVNRAESIMFCRSGGPTISALILDALRRCGATVFTHTDVVKRNFIGKFRQALHPRYVVPSLPFTFSLDRM